MVMPTRGRRLIYRHPSWMMIVITLGNQVFLKKTDPAIVPISTVVGQEPAAKLAITPTSEMQRETDYQASWKQAPDVSKVETTTGIVNVQYTDFEGQAINKDFTVPVNVFAKESDYATIYGDPASIPASDRVQTVIRFYDLTSKQLLLNSCRKLGTIMLPVP